MASPLRPLQVAIQRYPSTIVAETMSCTLGQRPNLSEHEITGTRSLFELVRGYLSGLIAHLMSVIQRCKYMIAWPKSPVLEENAIEVSEGGESSLLLLTGYGLRLNTIDHNNISGIITVHADSHSHLQKIKSGGKIEAEINTSAGYGYRLFPDWQTSYLWYDPLWLQNPTNESHIDEKTIEDRYPTLAPFYLAWRDIYEKSFEQQGCDRGSGLEPFPDIADRVAWEVEGFLIACWLVLQDDTERVTYTILAGTYQIDKKSTDSVLRQFLIDEDDIIRRDDH
ncbi:hypothetical protein BDBG_08937 [Blastomyces gilchristii SLH14081]|uniref:Uncharacterized protein n=1 Tax=Blastomyces gilchristii (strain SLH14081) TaxID=559298 RepID=A0A179V301_BLAGS|nr:uncharacterized protein BDBG_08937 [Blastomyces gilchristii SLH14081]OAT13808.1 hypothetical protein BDBG_08937 [Blastomyces gilchristii SLH14081]